MSQTCSPDTQGTLSSPTRLALHGYPVSNYFNTVRAAVLEKGIACNVVIERANQDADFLRCSAMGKIPYLQTPRGCIAETIAILEYLEEIMEGPSLWPDDPFFRAKARQTFNVLQVYVELPLRSLFPGTFMGGHNAAETVAAVRAALDRAMQALTHLVDPSPWLLGSQITYADLFAFYLFDIGERVVRFAWGTSLLDEVRGLRDWFETMSDRASSRLVLAEFQPAFSAYLRDKGAAWDEPKPKDTNHA